MNKRRPYEAVLADAVQVFTEAARLTISWRDSDGRERRRHADFAEFVTQAVAGAAANLGGVEEVLAGRSGSWEACCVREMIQSTVGGDDDYLIEHRTEPLTVVVAVDNLLFDIGFAELFEQAHDELDRREEAICASPDTDRPMFAVTDLPANQRAALEEIDYLREALDGLRVQEWTAYGQAFKQNVLRAAGEMLPRLRVPILVEVHLDWHDEDSSVPPWGPAFAIWERARDLTPLPGCGIPLKDYPPGDVTQMERDAGRDSLSRLRRGEVSA